MEKLSVCHCGEQSWTYAGDIRDPQLADSVCQDIRDHGIPICKFSDRNGIGLCFTADLYVPGYIRNYKNNQYGICKAVGE